MLRALLHPRRAHAQLWVPERLQKNHARAASPVCSQRLMTAAAWARQGADGEEQEWSVQLQPETPAEEEVARQLSAALSLWNDKQCAPAAVPLPAWLSVT